VRQVHGRRGRGGDAFANCARRPRGPEGRRYRPPPSTEAVNPCIGGCSSVAFCGQPTTWPIDLRTSARLRWCG
jgi:hypothetical protein